MRHDFNSLRLPHLLPAHLESQFAHRLADLLRELLRDHILHAAFLRLHRRRQLNFFERHLPAIVFERLLKKERQEVTRQIQDLKERTPQGGLATFGLNGTLEAINGGRVQTLYFLTSFSTAGGKCRQCNSLFLIPSAGKPSVPCPLCKGENRGVDLAEEMMKAVIHQDGEVKWVEENPILKESEGVGASLRFRFSH